MEIELSDSDIAELENLGVFRDRADIFKFSCPWNSVRFDIHMWSESAELDSLVTKWCNFVDCEAGFRVERIHVHLKVVVLNLFSCFNTHDGWYVAYQRGQNDYSPSSRYNELSINRKYIVKAVEVLVGLGLLENKPGYYDRKDKANSKISRMRATINLIEQIEACGEIKIVSHSSRECIIKRDQNKRDIEYGRTSGKGKRDSQLDIGMRERLSQINTLLAQTEIKLDMTEAEFRSLNRELRKTDRQEVNLDKFFLRRIFNKTFKKGGRFYNGWWQNAPRIYRSKILINGEPTVELDYTAIHPSLAYLEATGRLPASDPYALSAYNGDPVMRKLVKSIFLILLNAKSPAEAKKSLRREVPKNSKLSDEAKERFQNLSLTEVFDNIKSEHPAIWSYMGQGKGTHLQFLDSCIAEDVLISLAEKGIPALPVHDSFLVQQQHGNVLREAMGAAFVKQWGACPAIG